MPIIEPGHGQAVPRGPLLCLCDCTDQGLQSTLGTHDTPFLNSCHLAFMEMFVLTLLLWVPNLSPLLQS